MRTKLIEVLNDDFVIIAFENSLEKLEYKKYKLVDDGVMDMPECDPIAVLVSDNDSSEYIEYDMEVVNSCSK